MAIKHPDNRILLPIILSRQARKVIKLVSTLYIEVNSEVRISMMMETFMLKHQETASVWNLVRIDFKTDGKCKNCHFPYVQYIASTITK